MPEFDLTDRGAASARCVGPDVRTVINCAAFTDVDGAESARGRGATRSTAQGVGDAGAALRASSARRSSTTAPTTCSRARPTRPYPVDHPRAPLERLRPQQGGRAKSCSRLRRLPLPADPHELAVRALGQELRAHDPRAGADAATCCKVVDDQVGRPTSAEYLAERIARAAARRTRAAPST